MEYIAPSSAATVVICVASVAAFLAFAITLLAVNRGREEDRFWLPLVYLVVGCLSAVGIMVLGLNLTSQIEDDSADAQAETILERYGWEPTPLQFFELDYPRTEPEAGVRDLFGHTDINIDGRSITVQLAWDGRQLLVLDMSDATELDRTR